jgi:diguanylate cyclase (GGDEF)-like protein
MLNALLTKWGHSVVLTRDGQEAWRRLEQESSPRLVLLDWMMPKMDGLEVCRRIRKAAKEEDPYTYIILLTAKGSKENVVSGFEAGADDYIVKPFDEFELRARLKAGHRIIELQSELLKTKQDLLRQSLTDDLTDIMNRRAILSQLRRAMGRSKRTGEVLSVSLLDIDRFKSVNDTYGHPAGDIVLKECARRIKSMLRPYDLFGRFGGEEFMIVTPDVVETAASIAYERVRGAIEKNEIVLTNGSLLITASQGVAIWDEEEGLDELIARADKALYMAKDAGRNRIEFAPERAMARKV